MKPGSFKPIINGLIATTLALSSTWAMETIATTTTNPEGQALTNPMQHPFEMTISGRTLNSNNTVANLLSLGLITVPGEIGNLSALEELSLSRNKLTTVPVAIGDLSALMDLNLEGNALAGSESKWAKELKGAEFEEYLMFYTKKDLKRKTMMMLLANQHDNHSSLANLTLKLVRLIVSMHIDSRLG